jgi:voltage-gated potassium channel
LGYEEGKIGEAMTPAADLRRHFLMAFWQELRVVWPILSGLIGAQMVLGLFVGFLEGWRIGDAMYFTFVTGLTIGYGDLVPVRLGRG